MARGTLVWDAAFSDQVTRVVRVSWGLVMIQRPISAIQGLRGFCKASARVLFLSLESTLSLQY